MPLRRPGWMVPPLSWLMPFWSHRRIGLDAIGSTVLELCDGKRTIERIIEELRGRETLTLSEAQLAVAACCDSCWNEG